MMADRIKGMSDKELIENVHKSIINEYGIDGYIRYIRLIQPNNNGQDFMKIRDELNKTETLSQICEKETEYKKR